MKIFARLFKVPMMYVGVSNDRIITICRLAKYADEDNAVEFIVSSEIIRLKCLQTTERRSVKYKTLSSGDLRRYYFSKIETKTSIFPTSKHPHLIINFLEHLVTNRILKSLQGLLALIWRRKFESSTFLIVGYISSFHKNLSSISDWKLHKPWKSPAEKLHHCKWIVMHDIRGTSTMHQRTILINWNHFVFRKKTVLYEWDDKRPDLCKWLTGTKKSLF